jgi:hypothetical protein
MFAGARSTRSLTHGDLDAAGQANLLRHDGGLSERLVSRCRGTCSSVLRCRFGVLGVVWKGATLTLAARSVLEEGAIEFDDLQGPERNRPVAGVARKRNGGPRSFWGISGLRYEDIPFGMSLLGRQQHKM